jgi:hypothetical protein
MSERMRILLAELEPGIPADPVYATWSPTDRMPEIALSAGNLVASKSTLSAVDWAAVRGTTSMPVGAWYWETQVTYTGSADFLIGAMAEDQGLGLGRPGYAGLSIAVGRDGSIRCLGYYGDVGAVANGDVLRFLYDADAGTFAVARNGGAFVTAKLYGPLGAFGAPYRRPVLRPVVGLLRPSGSSVQVTANFGATPFLYPVPTGANQGVYTVPAPTRHTVYLSNNGFKTGAGEMPASTYYDGRIAGDSDVEFTREIGLSPWGNSTAARGGELSVINRDGGIDDWLAWEWRDAPFRLYAGREGDARASFQPWSYGVVDRIEGVDSRRMRIVLADPLARLDVPVQSELYPEETANAQLRGKPLPIVLGRPRWCEPQRVDPNPTQRMYRLHGHGEGQGGDSPGIGSISDAFDGGNRFGGAADPYAAHNPVTLLNGGNFNVWSLDAGGVSMPSNWARITGFSTTDRFEQGAGGGTLRLRSTGQARAAIYHSGSTLNARYRYQIAFSVTAVAKAGQITFRTDGPDLPPADVVVAITSTGAKTVILDVPEQAQLQIVLGRTELDATIDNLTVSSVQIIDWAYYTDGADRIGLTLANAPAGRITCHPVGPTVRFGAAVLERASDFAGWLFGRMFEDRGIEVVHALDGLGDAGSRRLATYLTQPVTYSALLREVMNSLLAGVWTARTGQVRALRWAEPDPAAVVLTLDERNIAGDIRIELDQAKSLRRRVAGRRNHSVHSDSEIAGGVSEALRQELKSEWGFTASGAEAAVGDERPTSAAYLAASDRDPLPTLLQDEADISALANELCTLWRPTRYFYDLSAVLDADAADALEPGQTVRLVWSRIAGLAGGVPLRVVRVRSRYFSRRVDLRLWGAAPPITAAAGGKKEGK